MLSSHKQFSIICTRCLRSQLSLTISKCLRQSAPNSGCSDLPQYSTRSTSHDGSDGRKSAVEETSRGRRSPSINTTLPVKGGEGEGAMSRRLAEASEDALLEGGKAGRRAIEEAGFSKELKARLLDKIQVQTFQAEHAAASAEVNLSSAAGEGTRSIATAQAWTGTEIPEDTVLRMLSDAHKPLKPGLRGPANLPVVDFRIKKEPKQSSGRRLANARDKTSIYAINKDSGMTDRERDALRKEFKERFSPASRAMPNSIRGLQALANERIEDAIARGQFKHIPRGKAIERDARADNPFIDTTEYLMNKMIQRQDIVPPWIEKQQELVKAANVFRTRLRNDWRRHAARSIASKGGSLQDQIRLAERYAESERKYNPKTKAVEQISVPTSATSDPVMVTITQNVAKTPDSESPLPVIEISNDPISTPVIKADPAHDDTSPVEGGTSQSASEIEGSEKIVRTSAPLPPLFRDPTWEAAEMSYLKLAIKDLNNTTRSYNLMAPDLAKKPYFNLERELRSCYADVAPQIGFAIKDRAAKPARELVEKIGHRPGGVMERIGGQSAKVYDSTRPEYGFKELWNDLWRSENKGA